MTYLPDVNVWIALAAERHIHHRAARHWFNNIHDETLVFCRITQMGFLRLLTNKHVMQEDAMNPDGAWKAYRLLRQEIGESATWPSRTNYTKCGTSSHRAG
jgi:toxin-antitoxin system PIN domain toxin